MAIFISGGSYVVNPSPLAISEGGTGQTTAADAINALVPVQTGNSGKVLTTNGTIVSWGSVGTGTVTSVSVTSANGFAGTVATSTTTPAITLTTSVTGVLKGNGTAISAASPADFAPGYETAVATASQTVFNTTINTTAESAGKAYLQIYANGVFQQEGASKQFTVTGANQITFNVGLLVGSDVVMFSYS